MNRLFFIPTFPMVRTVAYRQINRKFSSTTLCLAKRPHNMKERLTPSKGMKLARNAQHSIKERSSMPHISNKPHQHHRKLRSSKKRSKKVELAVTNDYDKFTQNFVHPFMDDVISFCIFLVCIYVGSMVFVGILLACALAWESFSDSSDYLD